MLPFFSEAERDWTGQMRWKSPAPISTAAILFS
jgi:hypothetical protein